MANQKSKIKVVIADDHQIFIEGIKALIKDADNILLVGEAVSGEQLLNLLNSKEVDVVLMDVYMPKMSGIEATQKIKASHPDVKVLGLTMMEDAKHISEMMKAGASGYLLKTTGKSELVDAIVRVQNGERYLSKEVSMKLIDRMLNNTQPSEQSGDRTPSITKREHEIIRLIAQELTNEEIARQLNNSPMTIITHRKNLLRKLNVKNTAGLVKYAVQHGLVD
ncbi:MAG TPA: response regulator transcription factor [Chitinophagales bacterium]|nr:response regulator transcription factor [Chitinophagales bacterium]